MPSKQQARESENENAVSTGKVGGWSRGWGYGESKVKTQLQFDWAGRGRMLGRYSSQLDVLAWAGDPASRMVR